MDKPRFTRKNPPVEKNSYDVFPFGANRGKTIGWMADNAPFVLEAWAKAKGYRLPQSIIERINKAKYYGQ